LTALGSSHSDQQNIVAVSAVNGRVAVAIPFETEYVQNIVTPVLFKEMLILSGPPIRNDGNQVDRTGRKWTTQQVWRNDQVAMYMNSRY
jgi:hypothetical protein